MPKHGWKWRTEQVRKMDHGALIELLGSEISGRLARWIYENLIPEPKTVGIASMCLVSIGWDDSTPKNQTFLWRELERHKADLLGDWAIIGLARSCNWSQANVERFISYYEDVSAHPMTRGSAVFGINSSMEPLWWLTNRQRNRVSEEFVSRVRAICAKACVDENPYARAGAAWLAKSLGGFDAELAILAKDEATVPDHGTVSSFVE